MNDNAVPRPENTSFTFDDVCLAPGEQIGLHEQATWELSYIIVGSGMRLIGDRTEPFGSGEVVAICPCASVTSFSKYRIAGISRMM